MERPILPVVLDDHAIEPMVEREIPADVLGACLACPARTGRARQPRRPGHGLKRSHYAELDIDGGRTLRVAARVARSGALVVHTCYWTTRRGG